MEKMTNAVYDQGYRDVIRSLTCVALGDFQVEITSPATQIKVTANNSLTAMPFLVDGSYYEKATTDTIDVTACATQAIGTRCRYLHSINKDGTITTTKGTEVVSATTGSIAIVSVNADNCRYTSTAASFTSFKVNDYVNITGFSYQGNNGVFRIKAIDVNGYWFEVTESRAVTEALGDSVTIIRESKLPDCPLAQAPISVMLVTTTSAVFTAGTTALTTIASWTPICAMPTGLIQ